MKMFVSSPVEVTNKNPNYIDIQYVRVFQFLKLYDFCIADFKKLSKMVF
jgi:hypothetical protein